MEYFDTNIYVYAFCKNVDDQEQKRISQHLLKDRIRNNKLLISEIILYEFAYVCNKLEEDPLVIQKNLNFLSRYVQATTINIHKRVIDILEKTNLYNSTFDIFHLAFCEHNECKIITFDKGFKRFKKFSTVEIEIRTNRTTV